MGSAEPICKTQLFKEQELNALNLILTFNFGHWNNLFKIQVLCYSTYLIKIVAKMFMFIFNWCEVRSTDRSLHANVNNANQNNVEKNVKKEKKDYVDKTFQSVSST